MSRPKEPFQMKILRGGGSTSFDASEIMALAMRDTPDFMIQTNTEGMIEYINQVFEAHGFVENVLGRPIVGFLRDASRSVLEEAFAWTQVHQKAKVVELQLELGFWMLCRVFPIHVEGKFMGHFLIATDITALKTAQAELAESNQDLSERVRKSVASLEAEAERVSQLEARLVDSQKLESLGALASGVAHEYNNLLTVILGNAGLAQMLLPEESQAREAIRHLETATLHAAELTNQLLTYSGFARVKLERLDLSQTIVELSVLVGAILKGGKSLQLECPADLPHVLGDLGQIQQMLMHLVRQAADNMGAESGLIRVETGLIRLSARELQTCVLQEGLVPSEMVFLRITDDGKRLTKAQCRYFFEPFSPRSKDPQTKGLSMAAVLGIVRTYGGTCKVFSSTEGNQVTLFFPVRSDLSEQKSEGAHHLLLVDDELAVRETMGSLLGQLGYSVRCIESGQAALEYLTTSDRKTSAVLLDANMPGMRGVVCFDAIRAQFPDIPIVVMSGFSEDQIRLIYKERLLQGVLQKPFRFPELERIVRETVGEP
jgi:two-component system, cell cycle sensor histidine kinase and response regulator CckA